MWSISQRHIKTAARAISFNPSSGEWGRAYEPCNLITYLLLDEATRFRLGKPYRGWYNWSSQCQNCLRPRTYPCQENRRPRVINYSFAARIKYISISSRVWMCVYTSFLVDLASFSISLAITMVAQEYKMQELCLTSVGSGPHSLQWRVNVVSHVPSRGGRMWLIRIHDLQGES